MTRKYPLVSDLITAGHELKNSNPIEVTMGYARHMSRYIAVEKAFDAFSAFPDDALVRIDPEVIRKKGRVPKNSSLFFTIFQTFMSGRDAAGNPAPSFGDYPPDFFDFIIIDECHRGGANDEGNWRGILEYFSPAVQLGLTATPKRKNNADTYGHLEK